MTLIHCNTPGEVGFVFLFFYPLTKGNSVFESLCGDDKGESVEIPNVSVSLLCSYILFCAFSILHYIRTVM